MDKLLTIDQVSELLQVKKNTIYSWTHTNRIPFVKINGALRFKEKVISSWIDSQVEEPKDHDLERRGHLLVHLGEVGRR